MAKRWTTFHLFNNSTLTTPSTQRVLCLPPPFEGMAHANHDGFEVYCAYNDNRNVEKLYPYIIHAKPFAIILAF